MKRLLLILIVSGFPGIMCAQQQPYRFGIKGGINYIHLENYGKGFYADFEAKPGWTAGLLFQFSRGDFLTWSVVPEILLTESRSEADMIYLTDYPATIRTLDIPVNLRLGLQLSKVFKPYVLGNIYGSMVINNTGDFFSLLDIDNTSSETTMNKYFFGFSAGLGFELWKFQVEGRYRWNMNKIRTDDFEALKQMGMELSIAFLLPAGKIKSPENP